MKRPSVEGRSDGCPPPAGKVLDGLVFLYAFLSDPEWDDGGARELGTVLVFCEGNHWKLCLNDRDQGRVGFVSGFTIEEALLSAETQLAEDRLDWRASGGRKNSGHR